ncbi:MAG: HDOD domain-containing protein [Methyloprofundus sp.]|nr:HDOD domain-containing protein [Methyloprofundus sp.]
MSSTLPTLDDVLAMFSLAERYQNIAYIVRDPQISAAEIAHFIAKTPHVSERILGLINSCLYKHQSPVDSIERGIAIVGVEEVLYLILLLSVIDVFEQKLSGRVDLRQFWQDSVDCGLMARLLAKKNGGLHSDNLFAIGFLRNIGSLVISQLMHELAEHIGGEQALSALNFSSVGADLLRVWRLPSAIYQPIEYQLQAEWQGAHHLDAKIIHIAALLCELSGKKDLTSDIVWREIPLEYRAILNMEKEGLFSVFKQEKNDREEVYKLLMRDELRPL